MKKVIIAGSSGRMGVMIMKAVKETAGLELAGAVERPDHPSVGVDAGIVAGLGENGVIVAGDLADVLSLGDVIIDFTSPQAAMKNLEIAAGAGKAIVIGATGLSAEDKGRAAELAEKTRVVMAPNMSVGVNLLFKIVGEVAKVLGPDYDVEIIESHHRMKKDAPSGTAVKLAEIIAEALDRNIDQCGVYGRHGLPGARTREEIGVLAVRAGDIVGDHTVLYGGIGERIEITHRAHSRETFARGAIRAAAWILSRPKGLYDMQDVLGLSQTNSD